MHDVRPHKVASSYTIIYLPHEYHDQHLPHTSSLSLEFHNLLHQSVVKPLKMSSMADDPGGINQRHYRPGRMFCCAMFETLGVGSTVGWQYHSSPRSRRPT